MPTALSPFLLSFDLVAFSCRGWARRLFGASRQRGHLSAASLIWGQRGLRASAAPTAPVSAQLLPCHGAGMLRIPAFDAPRPRLKDAVTSGALWKGLSRRPGKATWLFNKFKERNSQPSLLRGGNDKDSFKIRSLLVYFAFARASVDLGCWWLSRHHGFPLHPKSFIHTRVPLSLINLCES